MLDGTFGYDFSGAMPEKVRNAKLDFTERLCRRLEHVTLESRNALDVIACYDRPEAFHFVDPPYVNSDCGHYEGVFSEQNLEQLLQVLETVKGRFMLTMYPFPSIETYARKTDGAFMWFSAPSVWRNRIAAGRRSGLSAITNRRNRLHCSERFDVVEHRPVCPVDLSPVVGDVELPGD